MIGELKSATHNLLNDVMDETGVRLRVVSGFSGYPAQSRFGEYMIDPKLETITIAVSQPNNVDYLVAHEAARVRRFLTCDERDRYVLTSNDLRQSIAVRQMEQEAHGTSAGSDEFSQWALPVYYDGLLTQLVSAPADPWLNRWLFERYAALRDDIVVGLTDILETGFQCLEPEIEGATPSVVYRASNAINAQFAAAIGELLGRSEISALYQNTPFHQLGSELRYWNSTDRGFAGDRHTTDTWAGILEVDDWYEWQNVVMNKED